MENQFHEWLIKNLPRSSRAQIGIGDDAAVLDWSKDDDCVIASDMLAEGVHFILAEAGPEPVGRKALAVNLSDLAAMGGTPVAAVISLMLPANDPMLAERIVAGAQALAKEFDLSVVGGDTNCWSGDLVVSVTVIGTMAGRSPFRRDGAQPGDRLFVTGELGGSLLGHHLSFTPRVETALKLHDAVTVHAAMDISDGLAIDASRMARRSRCGIELHSSKIPISTAAKSISQQGSGKSPLQHALSDGEDFELFLAIPPSEDAAFMAKLINDHGLIPVGTCVNEEGLWLLDDNGARTVLAPVGYEH